MRRFAEYTNLYPWQWEPAEVEAFIVSRSIAPSTARNYQNCLRMFCEFVTDARYGWPAKCLELFGSAPRQILHEANTISHVAGPDGTVAPQLQPVLQALAAADHPRAVISWLAASPSLTLLARLASTGKPVSHERLDERNLALAELDQPSLDMWLASGNTNHYNIRNFLLWAASRHLAPTLTVPLRPRQQPEHILDETERCNILRRCLSDTTIPLDTRAAAALVLLFGLPISRIRHITLDQLDLSETGCFLRTGRHPLLLPPKLANLLTPLANTPHTAARLSPGDTPVRWLFPGLTPGRPTSQLAFTHKLRDLGINARTARNAALVSLAGDLPVPILADVLGLHTATAERWAHLATSDWTAYVAERAQHR